MTAFRSVEWLGDRLRLLDQRLLPEQVEYLDLTDHRSVAEAIANMTVRGAPVIGVSAAYGLVLAADADTNMDGPALRKRLEIAADELQQARPTAVNLRWALRRVLERVHALPDDSATTIREAVLLEANRIYREDGEVNRAIGAFGAALIPDHANIVHHCNTGALGTVEHGTALGVIHSAHAQNKQVHVYVDETRPRLQGARLTVWELTQLGVPHTLIVDSAAAHIMRTTGIDLCLVGCDRVAANGDVANKIGTYQLALAAHAHGVPFYVAAPLSTLDRQTASGDMIEIEERAAAEVTTIGDTLITLPGAAVRNPAFDITPAKYVTAFITEKGIVYPPFAAGLAKLFN